jgi:DNA replication and repair protein RecF
VRIRAITLQPFRNFNQFHLSLEADRVLIVGRNGHGKSNILEAISYLSIGKSVRGAKDHQVVPHGGQHFDIQALCNDGRRDCRLRIFYAQENGKRAFCNETPLTRVSDVLGIFRTVHFSPEDVSLVLRFPGQRRRVLDILISQSSAPYLRDLQRYRRVLTQRNHLLRTSKRGLQAPDQGVLQAWDTQLAQLGAKIRVCRLEALQILSAPLQSITTAFLPSRRKQR